MLTTDRLFLRKARRTDVDAIFAIMSDARAMAYWSTPPHADRAETAAIVHRMADAPGPALYLVIERDGAVIGMGGLHHDNEIGFILHPDHWRQGIMAEAMTALLSLVWQTTDFAFVHADADPLNAASVGFLTAMGFRKTHRAKNTFCVAGVWSDSVYFRLDRPTEAP